VDDLSAYQALRRTPVRLPALQRDMRPLRGNGQLAVQHQLRAAGILSRNELRSPVARDWQPPGTSPSVSRPGMELAIFTA